jgi:hypothetical protein
MRVRIRERIPISNGAEFAGKRALAEFSEALAKGRTPDAIGASR